MQKKEVLIFVSIFLIVFSSFIYAADGDIRTVMSQTRKPEIQASFEESSNIVDYILFDYETREEINLELISSSEDRMIYTYKPLDNLEEGQYYGFSIDATDDNGNLGENDFVFEIDLGDIEIRDYEPKNFMSTQSFEIYLYLNRDGICKGSSTEKFYDDMEITFQLEDDSEIYIHGVPYSRFNSDEVFVMCMDGKGEYSDLLTIPIQIDTTKPNMIEVDDTSKYIEFPEKTGQMDVLQVKFSAEDLESGISFINYSVQSATGTIVSDWKTTTKNDDWILIDQGIDDEDLILENGNKYYISAIAVNNAGLKSVTKKSNGITVDVSIIPVKPDINLPENNADNNGTGNEKPLVKLCENNILDDGEVAIDCGGICDPCSSGSKCNMADDCESKNCVSGICLAANCGDSILNGDESDVDCGNVCSNQKCDLGKICKIHDDCDSEVCDKLRKVCVSPSCNDKILNGIESDVDCGGNCTQKCELDKSCNENSDCDSGACKKGICDIETDKDGDGIDDSIEDLYDFLDPNNPDDAALDYDGDGITNFKETMHYDTNPGDKDSDGDGYSDKVEIDKGFDPNDPDDHPSSPILTIIIVIVILAALGGGGYYCYLNWATIKPALFSFLAKIGINVTDSSGKPMGGMNSLSTTFGQDMSLSGLNPNNISSVFGIDHLQNNPAMDGIPNPDIIPQEADIGSFSDSPFMIPEKESTQQSPLAKAKSTSAKKLKKRSRNDLFSSFDNSSKQNETLSENNQVAKSNTKKDVVSSLTTKNNLAPNVSSTNSNTSKINLNTTTKTQSNLLSKKTEVVDSNTKSSIDKTTNAFTNSSLTNTKNIIQPKKEDALKKLEAKLPNPNQINKSLEKKSIFDSIKDALHLDDKKEVIKVPNPEKIMSPTIPALSNKVELNTTRSNSDLVKTVVKNKNNIPLSKIVKSENLLNDIPPKNEPIQSKNTITPKVNISDLSPKKSVVPNKIVGENINNKVNSTEARRPIAKPTLRNSQSNLVQKRSPKNLSQNKIVSQSNKNVNTDKDIKKLFTTIESNKKYQDLLDVKKNSKLNKPNVKKL